ncbi:GIY-YIG nuclease family protein [Nonomuraea sp. NPDC050556]|uniref:GIY-YIG nuclease family protein n=1 Tax=Nonomuraea sp. NPDC050556 TaxID=3364369 RepID=UPI0037A69121
MDPRVFPPRLVIDPSLPPEVSLQLRASPHLLREARRGKRPAQPYHPTLLFVIPGLLLLSWMVADTEGMVVAGLVMALAGVLRWIAVGATNRDTRRRLELAHQHQAHYILPTDLDYPCQVLLRRAQDATDTILASEVHRAGLIDSVANNVTLPEEVWQISTRLSRLARMHHEHGRIVPRELPPGMDEAFKPYTSALDAAWTSLSKRVRQLEKYATQVVHADEVYRAHRRLQVLVDRTPDYQRLVAETVQDELAHTHIRELAQQAQHMRELFEESIDQARQAAGHLFRTPLS